MWGRYAQREHVPSCNPSPQQQSVHGITQGLRCRLPHPEELKLEPKHRRALHAGDCTDLPVLRGDADRRQGGASAKSPLAGGRFYFGGGVIGSGNGALDVG